MLKRLPIYLLTPIFAIAFIFPIVIAPALTHAAPPAETPGQSPPVETPGQSPPANTTDTSGGLVNPLKNIKTLDGLLSAVLDAIVHVLAPIFLTLAFIYVGFLFVMAQGNEEKIRSARSALVWTVIGALILLGANAIGLVISSTVSGL